MNVWRFNTTRSRLLGLLAGTIGGLVLVVIGVWIFNIEPALRQSVAVEQRKAAMHAADRISDFIDEKINDLRAAAQVGRLWQAGHDHRKESLYQLMKVVPAIRELSIVGPAGDEAMRVSRTRSFSDTDLRSLATADKFRQPMQGEVHIGPVYHEQSAEPFITLAVPIGSSAVEIQGVLIAEVNLKTLWDVVSHIKIGRSGYLYVVSGTGQLIAHYDYSKVVLGTNLSHVPEVEEFLRDPQHDAGFGDIEPGYAAPRVMTTYALVPKPRWGVVVEESVDTAFAEAHRLKLLAGIILSLAVLAMFAVSYRFSRRLTEPIRQLEKGAERIAAGELDHRLDIRTGDEIEELANKFNRMASALMESYSGLEAKVTDRTKEISSLYAALAPLKPADSLAQTLDNILIRLREATGADGARVRLWDKKQGLFTSPAASGFSATAGADERPGQLPVVDQAFNQGETIVIPDLATDPRIKRKQLLAGGFHSGAFLPLVVGSEMIGVVQLVSRTEGFFKREKKDHLSAIARQMGIALENRDLLEQSRRHLDRIRALHDIDVAIAQSLDLQKILDVLLEKIQVFLPLPAAYTVNLLNPENGAMEPAACRNLDEARWKESAGSGPNPTIPDALLRHSLVIKRNIQSDPRGPACSYCVKQGLVSYMAVPLMVKESLLGVLALYTHEEHDFTAEEIDFFTTLAGQAAIAINNSQLYEQTRKQTAELEKSTRIKDEFLGVMSHELRTPLNVIAGYANLLAENTFGSINPDQTKAMRVIKDRCEALTELVVTILEAANLASGTTAVTLEYVNLVDLLLTIKDAQQVKDSVTLNWEFSANLPDTLTDSGKLRQILNNLINNALKFTDSGSVTIAARLVKREMALVKRISPSIAECGLPISDTSAETAVRGPQSEIRNQDCIEFTVTDTGIGITSEAVPLIFEKFRQADSSDTRSYEGAGLGLFVVKKFTELLAGEVYVESEPGRGSTFTVTIPYVPCKAAGGASNGLSSASSALESPCRERHE